MKSNLTYSIIKICAYLLLAYFIYLLLLITLQYVPLDFDVAFLRLKQEEIKLKHYQFAFFSHVYTSIIVIIAGATQFSKYLRVHKKGIHKASGKVYILLTLLVACPSGLVMSYYANGGIISQISFVTLSILWFIFTLKAFTSIKNKDWKNHEKFMIRSYALTLSAISLRLLKWGIVSVFDLPPMDTYKIVSILGWTVNLAVAEVYIRIKVK